MNHDPNCHHGMIPRKNSVGFDKCPEHHVDVRIAAEAADTEAEWVFEGPDPEVGIFGDLILHTCAANSDEEPAEHTDTRIYDGVLHPDLVDEVAYFTCPACKATTTSTNTWPRSYFEDVR